MGPCASIWGSDIIKRIHPSIRGIRGGGIEQERWLRVSLLPRLLRELVLGHIIGISSDALNPCR